MCIRDSYYLGEEPILHNAPTYMPMFDKDRKEVLDRLGELVIKDVAEAGGYGDVYKRQLFGLCRELNTQAEGVEVGPAPVAEETNPEMNIPIEDLNLTQRSYNCLKREGIHTIGELVAHTEQDLLDIRNFGMKSIDEVKEKLQSLGLALKASPLGNFDTNNLEGGTFFSPEDE